MKKFFEEKFGEGTAFDLDYGKLLIIALLIYIAFFKSASSAIWQEKPVMCANKEQIMGLDERGETVRFFARQSTTVRDGESLKEETVSLKLAIFVNMETKSYSIIESHPTYKSFCILSYGKNFEEVNN